MNTTNEQTEKACHLVDGIKVCDWTAHQLELQFLLEPRGFERLAGWKAAGKESSRRVPKGLTVESLREFASATRPEFTHSVQEFTPLKMCRGFHGWSFPLIHGPR